MGVRYPARAERLERLRRELGEILLRIVDADTEKIVLFGSTARGDVGSASDLDLLVVRSDARRPVARVDDLYRRVGAGIAVDRILLTPRGLAEAEATRASCARRCARARCSISEASR
jgi:predicted nucleotidyltransferase